MLQGFNNNNLSTFYDLSTMKVLLLCFKPGNLKKDNSIIFYLPSNLTWRETFDCLNVGSRKTGCSDPHSQYAAKWYLKESTEKKQNKTKNPPPGLAIFGKSG